MYLDIVSEYLYSERYSNCNSQTFSWGCPLVYPVSRAPVVPHFGPPPRGHFHLITMAAFMVGKSMKERRQTKAIEELFDRADKNGNGKISVEEYVMIFSDHGITLRLEQDFTLFVCYSFVFTRDFRGSL